MGPATERVRTVRLPRMKGGIPAAFTSITLSTRTCIATAKRECDSNRMHPREAFWGTRTVCRSRPGGLRRAFLSWGKRCGALAVPVCARGASRAARAAGLAPAGPKWIIPNDRPGRSFLFQAAAHQVFSLPTRLRYPSCRNQLLGEQQGIQRCPGSITSSKDAADTWDRDKLYANFMRLAPFIRAALLFSPSRLRPILGVPCTLWHSGTGGSAL